MQWWPLSRWIVRCSLKKFAALSPHSNITVDSLYEAYPDWNISIKHEQKLLLAHDRIVLQFPLYWYRVPALLGLEIIQPLNSLICRISIIKTSIRRDPMSELNALFRKKIGIPEQTPITFTMLNTILDQTAAAFPFENLCIIANKTESITKQSLMQKMLVRNEGGLCYELNPLLYYFLIDNGFQATLVRGEVYNKEKQDWYRLGRTHVAILLQNEEQTYLLDTGFGTNLPLKPVPLSGETVISRNGEFRIRKHQSDYGNYVLEMKLKYKHSDWQLGYAFDADRPVENVTEINEIKDIVVYDERSNFNKKPLITQLTSDGSITLTKTSFTQWKHGELKKEQIEESRFKQLAEQYFGFQDIGS